MVAGGEHGCVKGAGLGLMVRFLRDSVEEGPASSQAHGDEAEESPTMDDRIWALLPPELYENILAGLPVAQLFRMRTVCRRFRALTQSPSFVSSWTAMAAPEHWLLMFHRQDVAPWISMAAYDPRIKHWYNLPVQRPFFVKNGDESLASAQGLVCIARAEDTQHSLVVWNPLTNVWRELRGMSIESHMCVGLVVDSATKAFVVVVVGLTEELLLVTEVYDSAEGFWKPMHTSWKFIEWIGVHVSGSLVHCNGCFHAISAHETETDLCLISYDLKQGVWKETCKLPIAGNLFDVSPSLFEVMPGRLFLAGRTFLGPNPGEEPYAIHLWELKQLEDGDDATVEWIQVVAVPQRIIVVMQRECWTRRERWAKLYFECQAIGNLVCFIAEDDLRGLVYDLARDAWHWMPRRRKRRLDHVVSFEPRLDMLSA